MLVFYYTKCGRSFVATKKWCFYTPFNYRHFITPIYWGVSKHQFWGQLCCHHFWCYDTLILFTVFELAGHYTLVASERFNTITNLNNSNQLNLQSKINLYTHFSSKIEDKKSRFLQKRWKFWFQEAVTVLSTIPLLAVILFSFRPFTPILGMESIQRSIPWRWNKTGMLPVEKQCKNWCAKWSHDRLFHALISWWMIWCYLWFNEVKRTIT